MCFGRPATSARSDCAASASPSMRDDLCDVALAAAALVVEQARDALVGIRFEVAEREVLEFPFQLPDAEPVGERRVDVARELRQRDALFGGQSRRHGACAPVAATAGSAPRAGRGRSPAAAGAALRCCRDVLRSACSAHTCVAARWPSSMMPTAGELACEPGLQPLPQARHDMQDRGREHVALRLEHRQRRQRLGDHAERIAWRLVDRRRVQQRLAQGRPRSAHSRASPAGRSGTRETRARTATRSGRSSVVGERECLH